MSNDKQKISILVAGAAGQGVESGGQGLVKVLKRCGLHVFGVSDYMSLIKGGHNFYQIVISDEPVYALTEKFHLVICFDPQNVENNLQHIRQLHEGGLFIVDDSITLKPEYQAVIEETHTQMLRLPLIDLAENVGGSRIMANTAALGGVLGFLNLPFEPLEQVVRENFSKKNTQIADKNAAVAKAGYQHVLENHASAFKFAIPKTNPSLSGKMLINGNEAISFGAYAAGCRFISAYPMTPGTSVLEWFTKRNAELGVVTKHTEDEVASLCMAIGAAQVGARAMTTTSGGGFCLMVEALGLAGMTEVPVVVVNAMRGGPSTGLPTRTEQADLLFAVNASHGDFPKIVLCPGTTEQCYEAGVRAHNLAAKYQLPVIILTDQLLAAVIRDTNPADFSLPTVEYGKLLSKEELDQLEEHYLRYKFTEDGVSPRALPGHPKAVYAPSTDEHDESGHITEDSANRVRMMQKRMQKLETARQEIKGPEWYGPEKADLTLIVWGSTVGAALEAIDLLNRSSGTSLTANVLHFTEVWPFPIAATQEALSKVQQAVAVEQNYNSQFARLLKAETGYQIEEHLNRYDGRPIEPEEIVRFLQNLKKKTMAKV